MTAKREQIEAIDEMIIAEHTNSEIRDEVGVSLEIIEKRWRLLREAQQRNPWGSRRYGMALLDPDKLQAKDAAEYLGVAVGWLRKHVKYSEWHHCYLQKTSKAIAYFWHKEDLDAIQGPELEAARSRIRKRRAVPGMAKRLKAK